MALAAMLAFAQQGSNGSAGDQGRGTPAGRGSPGSQHRSHRYRLEDERYHPPEVLQASNTCGLLVGAVAAWAWEGTCSEGRAVGAWTPQV